jgi:FkbM family methyltransferase
MDFTAMQREAKTAQLAAEILGEGATTVLDVGARWGAGGVWWRLDPLARLIGFDPDPVECARLNALLPPGARERFVPVALGREPGPATLNITLEPGCSSVFPPDEALADRFPGLSVIKVAKRETIQLETLDRWAESEGIDEITFAKLDTQGCELDILRGGEQALSQCLGLEVEVEFASIYQRLDLSRRAVVRRGRYLFAQPRLCAVALERAVSLLRTLHRIGHRRGDR